MPLGGIAPSNARAVLQVEIAEQDRAFLREGLPVKLKFSAFPYQRYGVHQRHAGVHLARHQAVGADQAAGLRGARDAGARPLPGRRHQVPAALRHDGHGRSRRARAAPDRPCAGPVPADRRLSRTSAIPCSDLPKEQIEMTTIVKIDGEAIDVAEFIADLEADRPVRRAHRAARAGTAHGARRQEAGHPGAREKRSRSAPTSSAACAACTGRRDTNKYLDALRRQPRRIRGLHHRRPVPGEDDGAGLQRRGRARRTSSSTRRSSTASRSATSCSTPKARPRR